MKKKLKSLLFSSNFHSFSCQKYPFPKINRGFWAIKEELLDAIEEGVRKFVRTTLEVYAKDEFLRYIGARSYERTEKRKDYRNGSLHKTILTPFGLIEDVNIPRGRKGGFVPKVIERFKTSGCVKSQKI